MSEFKQWIIWGCLALVVVYLVSTRGFGFVGSILYWMHEEFGRL